MQRKNVYRDDRENSGFAQGNRNNIFLWLYIIWSETHFFVWVLENTKICFLYTDVWVLENMKPAFCILACRGLMVDTAEVLLEE